MSPAREDALRWVGEGTALVERAVQALGEADAAFTEPSALPGWTRKHLLAHLAANGDALCNLATWARTGVETPMYASREQRNADIEAGAGEAAAELRAWFDRSAEVLESDLAALSEEEWAREVRTAQGRTVPASEIPWMRAREVMVHAVDVGSVVGFDDLPDDFCAALLDDIAAKRSSAGDNPALTVRPDGADRTWTVDGAGEPATVTGPIQQVTAYLAGREFTDVSAEGGVPDLPPWL